MPETIIQNIPVYYQWDTCTFFLPPREKAPDGSYVCGKPAVVKLPTLIKYPVDNKGTLRSVDAFLCLKHWTEKHSEKK